VACSLCSRHGCRYRRSLARARLSIIDRPLRLLHDSRVDAELLCPTCRIPLTEIRTGNGIIWRCEKCDGRAVGLQLLRRTFTPESINPLWLHAIHNEGMSARPCPSCGNAMIDVALDSSSGIRVEVCRICEFVWFDAGETQTLQARPLSKPPPPLPQKARETIALAKVQQLAEQARGPDFDAALPEIDCGFFSGRRSNLTRRAGTTSGSLGAIRSPSCNLARAPYSSGPVRG
jgi:Zn-finger nucleic acid-binding protein